MKLNLIGIGPISSKIVSKINDEGCITFVYFDNIGGFDLESNEVAFQASLSNLSVDMSNIQETYCFVDSKEGIAGITLSLLQKFSDKDITVFIITHNCQSVTEKANQKIIYNVLQEYARSGVFKALFIINYDKLFDYIVYNMPDDINISIYDINEKIIDKVIFGVHIYWRLLNETYIEGEKLLFDDTIYRIKTFFDLLENTDYMYENLLYIGNKIVIKGLCDVMQKKDLLNLQEFKKEMTIKGNRYILLKSEFPFLLGIAETKIVQ